MEPHDLQCHMKNNFYTHYDKLDYPSIAQINRVVKENGVFLIFAVSEAQRGLYDQLSRRIQGAHASEMDSNSAEIVQLIANQYRSIQSVLRIRQEPSQIDGLQITFTYQCGDEIKESSTGTVECPIKPTAKFQ